MRELQRRQEDLQAAEKPFILASAMVVIGFLFVTNPPGVRAMIYPALGTAMGLLWQWSMKSSLPSFWESRIQGFAFSIALSTGLIPLLQLKRAEVWAQVPGSLIVSGGIMLAFYGTLLLSRKSISTALHAMEGEADHDSRTNANAQPTAGG